MAGEDLVGKIGLDTSGFVSGVQGVMGSLSSLQGALVAVGAVAAAAFVWDKGLEFQDGLISIQNHARGTLPALDDLKASVVDLANNQLRGAFAAGEVASALGDVVRETETYEEATAILVAGGRLAAAEHLALADSANLVADVLSAYKLPASEAARVTNLLFEASKQTGTAVTDLGASAVEAAAAARAHGLAIEEVVVTTAVLSDAGVDSLKPLLAAWQNLAERGEQVTKGGSKTVALFREFGISAKVAAEGGAAMDEALGFLVQAMRESGLNAEQTRAKLQDAFGPGTTDLVLKVAAGQQLVEDVTKRVKDETGKLVTVVDAKATAARNATAVEKLHATVMNELADSGEVVNEKVQKAAKLFDELGIKTTDANAKLRPMNELFGELKTKFDQGGTSAETMGQKVLEAFGDKLGAAVLAYIANMDEVDRVSKVATDSVEELGDAAERATTPWNRLANRIETGAGSIGDAVAGPLNVFIDWLVGAHPYLDGVNTRLQKLVDLMGTLGRGDFKSAFDSLTAFFVQTGVDLAQNLGLTPKADSAAQTKRDEEINKLAEAITKRQQEFLDAVGLGQTNLNGIQFSPQGIAKALIENSSGFGVSGVGLYVGDADDPRREVVKRLFGLLPALAQGFYPGVALPSGTGTSLPGLAHGVDTIVKNPSLFMVGEHGPERLTVTPQVRGARTGGDAPNVVVFQPGAVVVTGDQASRLRDELRRLGIVG